MQEYISSLFHYDAYNLFVMSSYNIWLVVLSISIAVFSSFMGFQVASQASNSSPIRKHLSLIIGSVVFGGGVWSMHFIGMLALDLCTTVTYNVKLTTISVLPSIIASWIALNIITRDEIKWSQLIIGGALVGAGIGTMHYVGMAAMEMAPLLRYNLITFCVSILVAVSLAILSLWIRFGLKEAGVLWLNKNAQVAIASCVMGAAISSMHYTGMAAARFVSPPGMELSNQTSDISLFLAMVITCITVSLIFSVLATNLIFRYKDKSIAATNNERRLIATMNTASDGIITINSNGIIISVNNAVSTLLGWPPEDLIGKNVKMIVPGTDQDNHDQYIKNYLLTRESKIIGKDREVEVLTKNEEKIPVRLSIGHVELNEQQMFVAFISDLRERNKMENKLRDNEAQIRSLVTNIPGIAYRCLDVPGWPNVFINDEVENIIGYPAEDFLLPDPKRSIGDFVYPEDMDEIILTDLRHPDGYKLEFRIIDRYNKIKWMLGYGRALKADNSENYYLDGFIMDITDRKKMESALIAEKEKAEKSATTRSAFLANMSHEIRTPMNAIIGYSDILLNEEALTTNQRKQLSTINQSANSLLHILNDVLDSAKLDKGKFQLEYRDFSLVEEVDSVVSTLWLQAQSKGLEINLNIDKSVQRYYNGAPDRIRQVFTNILGNAIKFTEEGNVTINIKEEVYNFLNFSIVDTGIGMTPTQLETIFDAFAQADESMSRRFGGTGLGTTISQQLVNLMGGTITVSSEYGKGSVFEFSIPLKKIEAITEEKTKEINAGLPPLHILIVDDIEQNIDLLSLILKRNNHTVAIAINGEQALLKMENESFDLVLMDIQMPIMDGLTAARERRIFEFEHGLPKLPIIALTASVLPQDKKSAEQAGMNGFSNKPIDVRQLMGEISRTLTNENIKPIKNEQASTEKSSIDLVLGINLWGSKTTLFTEIIGFLEHSLVEINSLPSLINHNDWENVVAISHKYKGVAGNLALSKLMQYFGELEYSGKQHLVEESLQCLPNIQTEVSLIQECAQKMTNKTNKASVLPVNKESHQLLLDTLAQLEQHVKNNEFNESPLETLEEINSSYTKEINQIISSCNDFDFEVAENQIKSLVELLNNA